MENDRRGQIITLALVAVALILWQLRALEAVVLAACFVMGGGAVLKLTTGTRSVRDAAGKAANWLGRRLAG